MHDQHDHAEGHERQAQTGSLAQRPLALAIQPDREHDQRGGEQQRVQERRGQQEHRADQADGPVQQTLVPRATTTRPIAVRGARHAAPRLPRHGLLEIGPPGPRLRAVGEGQRTHRYRPVGRALDNPPQHQLFVPGQPGRIRLPYHDGGLLLIAVGRPHLQHAPGGQIQQCPLDRVGGHPVLVYQQVHDGRRIVPQVRSRRYRIDRAGPAGEPDGVVGHRPHQRRHQQQQHEPGHPPRVGAAVPVPSSFRPPPQPDLRVTSSTSRSLPAGWLVS